MDAIQFVGRVYGAYSNKFYGLAVGTRFCTDFENNSIIQNYSIDVFMYIPKGFFFFPFRYYSRLFGYITTKYHYVKIVFIKYSERIN